MKYLILALALLCTACGGAPAATTSALTISKNVVCSKVNGSYYYGYNVVTYSTGDVWVGCEVDTTSGQNYESVWYKASQGGATNYYCSLTADIDAATSGYWVFTTTSGTKKAVYNDTPSASNGLTITFAPTDCNTY